MLEEMREDVLLIKMRKRKAAKAGLEEGKAKGQAATSVLVPAVGWPRKKLAAKKLTCVTQDLKEAKAIKVPESERIRKKKEEEAAKIKRRAEEAVAKAKLGMEAPIEKAMASLPWKTISEVVDEMISALEGIDIEDRELDENVEEDAVNFLVDEEEEEGLQDVYIAAKGKKEER